MEINNNIKEKINKRELWRKQFGKQFTGYDVFGRFVSQCCSDTKCCSSVALVLPETYGGKNTIENGIILHPLSVEEKGNKLYGIVNKKYFRIKNNRDGTGKIIIRHRKETGKITINDRKED